MHKGIAGNRAEQIQKKMNIDTVIKGPTSPTRSMVTPHTKTVVSDLQGGAVLHNSSQKFCIHK